MEIGHISISLELISDQILIWECILTSLTFTTQQNRRSDVAGRVVVRLGPEILSDGLQLLQVSLDPRHFAIVVQLGSQFLRFLEKTFDRHGDRLLISSWFSVDFQLIPTKCPDRSNWNPNLTVIGDLTAKFWIFSLRIMWLLRYFHDSKFVNKNFRKAAFSVCYAIRMNWSALVIIKLRTFNQNPRPLSPFRASTRICRDVQTKSGLLSKARPTIPEANSRTSRLPRDHRYRFKGLFGESFRFENFEIAF